MIGLFLNTASSYLHVGLMVDGLLKDQIYEKFDHDLSKMALVRVSELLRRNEILPFNVDRVYVVEGPGSFTGLRVGVTIAKTFAWGLDKELYALSNLFIMASSVVGYDYVIPIIDARRGYVYAGIYNDFGKAVMDDCYISFKELQERVAELCGTFAYVKLDYDNFAEFFVSDNNREIVLNYVPNLNNSWRYLDCEKVDYFSFEPKYLKKTEAEENLENDTKH